MELETAINAWQVARAEANEDSSTLDLTAEGDFSVVSVANGWFKVPEIAGKSRVNGLQFIAYGGNAANDTFNYRILTAAIANGPAEPVEIGQGILGTQPVLIDPATGAEKSNRFWVDTFGTITNYWWIAGSGKVSNASNFIDGRRIDGLGSGWYKIEVTNADNTTGIEAGNIKWFWKFY